MFKKILVAYDGSDTAKRALNLALAMARLYTGELDLISVQAPLPHYLSYGRKGSAGDREQAREYFHQLHREAMSVADEAEVILHPHLAQGHEVEAVINFIKEHEVDLLVIGQVGHTNLLQRVWGGTAQNLARLAPCSVLVVR